MIDIQDLLQAVKQEAENGNGECLKLLHHHWKTHEDCVKAILILYTCMRIDEKTPNLFQTNASGIIELTETGKWDEALWELYPTAMAAIYTREGSDGKF